MAKISVSRFGGVNTRLAPHLIPEFQAVKAINCDFVSGELAPLPGVTYLENLANTQPVKSFYRWGQSVWLSSINNASYIRGPVPGDTLERTYIAGDGTPKLTYSPIASSSGGPYPGATYALGIPKPTLSPSVALTGSASAGTDPATDTVNRSYVYTYVSALGEEGPPCAPSAIVAWLPGQSVNLSGMSTAPSGSYNITKKRIYRTATGASGTAFYFVAEINVATTTYTDTVSDAALAELLLSDEWYAPPGDLFAIGCMGNGIAYGCSKNQLVLSDPYLPHAWNPDNALTSTHTLVGAGHFDTTIVALTHRNPYLCTGSDPRNFVMDELMIGQGCVSGRSVSSTRYGVVYASPDGLILINRQGDKNLTAPFLTPEQWRALNPSSITGAFHDNRYIGFYDAGGSVKGCLIFDFTDSDSPLSFSSVFANAAFDDALADSLYVCQFNSSANQIHTWRTGSNLTYTWKSKEFLLPSETTMTAAKVKARSYTDLNFNLYTDGVLRFSIAVQSDQAFRLPAGYRSELYQFELTGTDRVISVDIAETMAEMAPV